MAHHEAVQKPGNVVAGRSGRIGGGQREEVASVGYNPPRLDRGAGNEEGIPGSLSDLHQRLTERGPGSVIGVLAPEKGRKPLARMRSRLEGQKRKQRQCFSAEGGGICRGADEGRAGEQPECGRAHRTVLRGWLQGTDVSRCGKMNSR